MKEIIRQVGPCTLARRNDYFVVLVQSILSQQVSVKAAEAMYVKLRRALPNKRVNPLTVLAFLEQASEDDIRGCGLSRQKRVYVELLAQRFVSKDIAPRKFASMPDSELIEHLTQSKGIGVWTAQMLLIFALNRADVWPVGDLGLRERVSRFYKVDREDYDAIEGIGQRFRPFRSIATWYLWRSKTFE